MTIMENAEADDRDIVVIPRGLGGPDMASYVALRGDREIAWASFRRGERGPFATTVLVAEEARRCGVATRIYAMAADYFGCAIVPSTELTPGSVAFWNARGVPIPEGAVVRTMAEWEELRSRPRSS